MERQTSAESTTDVHVSRYRPLHTLLENKIGGKRVMNKVGEKPTTI